MTVMREDRQKKKRDFAVKAIGRLLDTHAGVHDSQCRAWSLDVQSGTYLKHCTCEVKKAWNQLRKKPKS